MIIDYQTIFIKLKLNWGLFSLLLNFLIMLKTTIKTLKACMILLLLSQTFYSQVDREGRFYNETWTNGVSKNLVSDYGANGNDNNNDSKILQGAIDELTKLPNGGRIFIPKGTYFLKFINLRSNVHLVFAGGTVVKPSDTKSFGYIFGMGINDKVENVSVRGNGGRFTVDNSSSKLNDKLRTFRMGNVTNFFVANVNIIDNFTEFAGFACIKEHQGQYPRKGIFKNADIKNARFGWGLVQVLMGETILFKNLTGTGGVTLRLETRIENPVINDIIGRNISNRDGHATVFVSPHECNCGTFDIQNVKSFGNGFAVRIERGHSDTPGGPRGTFNSNSKVNGIRAEYGTKAQIRSDHRDFVPCELRNLISNNIKVDSQSYEGPSMAPILYENGNGAGFSNISLSNIQKIGFNSQRKSILNQNDKVKKCTNTGGAGSGSNVPNNRNPIVTLRKNNSQGFAIDGGNGGKNGQNVYLWPYNSNNVNQQWEEINRGGGFYSYKKRNTDFCIDGNNGGKNGQNLHLWSCNSNNQNQQFRKVSLGNGRYRLEKRNASNISIDGNNGGANRQNVHMWSSNNNNGNQQWIITQTSTAGNKFIEETLSIGSQIYPVPADEFIEISNINAQVQSFQIVNVLGQVLIESNINVSNNGVSIDVSGLEPGFYLIKIGEKTLKFVKK